MKKNLVCAAVAVTALGVAGIAQAVPIYFDFTGTVNGLGVSGAAYPSPYESWIGQSFSAGFTFETERLFAGPLGTDPLSVDFVDYGNPGPDQSSSHLTIGDETMAFPSQANQYTVMTFNDACSPAPPTCTPHRYEDLVLFGFTSDMPLDYSTGATGTFHSSSLYFFSSVPMVTNPLDPLDRLPAFDYFDVLAGIDPTLILSLPMYDMQASFTVQETICDNGNCVQGAIVTTGLNVTSVTRGIASTSVPEPGTLGLFGVALAGMLFLRRRQTALLQR
jgi:hypothetical protein